MGETFQCLLVGGPEDGRMCERSFPAEILTFPVPGPVRPIKEPFTVEDLLEPHVTSEYRFCGIAYGRRVYEYAPELVGCDHALTFLLAGYKVRRARWNKDVYAVRDGQQFKRKPEHYMGCGLWLPDADDLLATDWEIL